MSHLIDRTTRTQGAAFFADHAAWHGLGVVVDGAQTSADAIRLAGLDWSVAKFPLRATLADGSMIDVPERFAVIRTDTNSPLGVVGDDYTPLENREAFAFLDSVIGDGLCRYESAGSLKDGKRIWLLARLPNEIQLGVNGVDKVVPYALLANGHDGSLAVTVVPTTVRVVCHNTFTLALGRAERESCGIRIRHSQSIRGKIDDARAALGLVVKRVDMFQTEIDALARVSLPETRLRDYFDRVFPSKAKAKRRPAPVQPVVDGGSLLDSVLAATERNAEECRFVADVLDEQADRERERLKKIYEQVLENYHNDGNTLPGIEGTAWAAFNAVTEYADHQRSTRGVNDRDRSDNRLYSNWFGGSNDVKQVAYEQALAMAQ